MPDLSEPGSIFHGVIPAVHSALQGLGVEPPAPLDYPEELHAFLRRRVWETDLGTMRDSSNWPVFMKPRHRGKEFGGLLVKAPRNLLSTTELPDDYTVWASEPLVIESEWRVFVLKGEVQDIRPYSMNPFRTTPSQEMIEAMVAAYAAGPIAYALDVCVAKGRETCLVEANDAYSLGPYGIEPMAYSKMIQTRWEQLRSQRKDEG